MEVLIIFFGLPLSLYLISLFIWRKPKQKLFKHEEQEKEYEANQIFGRNV